MAIFIDTVYQRVLALANKEQRGYITPQEFNLLAGKAQLDIFNQYFHDYKTALLSPAGAAKISDDIAILEQKIDLHRIKAVAVTNNILSSDVYHLESLYYTHSTLGVIVIKEVNIRDFHQITSNAKLSPTISRPVFHRGDSSTRTIITSALIVNAEIKHDYIKKPAKPVWGYAVVGEKALYSSNTSTDFELHPAEESNLTNKILELAGIIINKPGLSEVILRNQAVKEAKENR